jgi:hypothetical protein
MDSEVHGHLQMHRTGHDPVQFVIDQARRRAVLNQVLAQLIVALSVCCGAAIVLLLTGTQLLEWYWAALLGSGALVITLWRVRSRLPSAYEVAQSLDARLSLHDSLSTAWYFSHHPDRHVDSGIVKGQHAMAAEYSRSVDVRAAVPLTVPRSAYLLFTLFAATSLLFAVRYGMRRELDIRAPLVQVFYDVFGGRLETRAAVDRRKSHDRNPWESEPLSATQAEEKRYEDEKQLDAAPDKVLDTIEVPDVENDRAGTEQGKGKQGEGQSPDGDPLEGEPGEGAETGREGDGNQDGEAGKDSESESGSKTAPNSMNDNSSLAQKFRDALANLMSKMKQQAGEGQSKQSQAGNTAQQSASQQGSQGKQQAQSKSAGEQGGEGEEGSEQGEGQKSEGSGKGKSSEQASSQTPGSGVGKQDGDKDIKAAEQLEAMGKISEILGKRAQNVTGEMTVEVQQSKQGIRTPYSPSSTAHSQAGTEIRRDEVPPALQHYVQQYFEKVRKQQGRSAPDNSSRP